MTELASAASQGRPEYLPRSERLEFWDAPKWKEHNLSRHLAARVVFWTMVVLLALLFLFYGLYMVTGFTEKTTMDFALPVSWFFVIATLILLHRQFEVIEPRILMFFPLTKDDLRFVGAYLGAENIIKESLGQMIHVLAAGLPLLTIVGGFLLFPLFVLIHQVLAVFVGPIGIALALPIGFLIVHCIMSSRGQFAPLVELVKDGVISIGQAKRLFAVLAVHRSVTPMLFAFCLFILGAALHPVLERFVDPEDASRRVLEAFDPTAVTGRLTVFFGLLAVVAAVLYPYRGLMTTDTFTLFGAGIGVTALLGLGLGPVGGATLSAVYALLWDFYQTRKLAGSRTISLALIGAIVTTVTGLVLTMCLDPWGTNPGVIALWMIGIWTSLLWDAYLGENLEALRLKPSRGGIDRQNYGS